MTPDFRITADGQDVTTAFQSRLLRLQISDEAGVKSDKVSIRLDDRDTALALPRRGTQLAVALGYAEEGVQPMGTFVVDEVRLGGPPYSMSIQARSADMMKGLKAPRTRTWGAISLGDIVSTIAGTYGLAAAVCKDLHDIQVSYLLQTQESDLHMLTRLARHYGAVTKPVDGLLVFAKKGQAKSVSGKPVSEVDVRPQDIRSFEVSFKERQAFKTVEALWFDKVRASQRSVHIGEGDPVFTLRHTYDTEAAAMAAAQAKLAMLQRETGELTITLPGNPAFRAGGIARLNGVRTGVDGAWFVETVEHSLDNNGYSCRVKLVV